MNDNLETNSFYANIYLGDFYGMKSFINSILGPNVVFKRLYYSVNTYDREPKVKSLLEDGRNRGCLEDLSPDEKYEPRQDEIFTCFYKYRNGQCCVIAIVSWKGNLEEDVLYTIKENNKLIFQSTTPTNRGRVGGNDCTCQGPLHSKNRGASFSYGHSFQVANSGCKYKHSDPKEIPKISGITDDTVHDALIHLNNCEKLVNNLLLKYLPHVHEKMSNYGHKDCKFGDPENDLPKPFNGVTITSDFAAHVHTDTNNWEGGVSTLLSLSEGLENQGYHSLVRYSLHRNSNKGGCHFLLGYGALLMECAKYERHANSHVLNPNCLDPVRISMVFYAHKEMDSGHQIKHPRK